MQGGYVVNNDKINYWQSVWEKIYGKANTPTDLATNSAGWISSFTNLPIPENEILEYLTNTSHRILKLSPKNVLEIGCGTGMILFRIAPFCNSYLGTDISLNAIKYTESARQHFDLSNVKLSYGDINSIKFDRKFDTVIINSVSQYFPDIQYLDSVIEKGLDLVGDQGSIFVGDVRPKKLLGLFNAAVEFHWAKNEMSIEHLRNRIETYIEKEEELLVDPTYFLKLRKRFKKISRVEMQLKHSIYKNEVSFYRYDVVLHIGLSDQANYLKTRYIDWVYEKMNLSELQKLLSLKKSHKIIIRGVPNARIANDIFLWEYLSSFSNKKIDTVGDLRSYIETIRYDNFLDPNEVWNMCEKWNVDVDVFWSLSAPPGYYDVVITP